MENNEAKYLDEINELKNEVVRLSGIESLLTERNLNNEKENNDLKDKIRTVTINSDSIEEEFDSLRDLNNELKFEIRRNNEQIAELNDLKDRLNEDLNAFDKEESRSSLFRFSYERRAFIIEVRNVFSSN